MRFLLYFMLLFILSVTACEKECIKSRFNFGLVGFSETEAEQIIFRRFDKNNATTPRDTFFFKQLQYDRRGDTLTITGGDIPVDPIMESGYHYEIYLPTAGNLFRVTEIIEEKNTMTKGLFNCTKEACENKITSYKLNGELKGAVFFLDRIYLTK